MDLKQSMDKLRKFGHQNRMDVDNIRTFFDMKEGEGSKTFRDSDIIYKDDPKFTPSVIAEVYSKMILCDENKPFKSCTRTVDDLVYYLLP